MCVCVCNVYIGGNGYDDSSSNLMLDALHFSSRQHALEIYEYNYSSSSYEKKLLDRIGPVTLIYQPVNEKKTKL